MNRETYLKELFGEDKEKLCKKHHKALEKAHEIRKFEIDLYWKRTLYFWGFQVVIFLAFSNFCSKTEWLIASIMSFLGLITAYMWSLANRASKFWQENWELHIDLLEEEITGNLYKNVLCYKENQNNAFSVSKINLRLSEVFSIAWMVLLIITFSKTEFFNKINFVDSVPLLVFITAIVAIIFLLSKITNFCRTNFSHSKNIEIGAYRENDLILKSRSVKGFLG